MKGQGNGRRPTATPPGTQGWREDWHGEDDLVAMADVLIQGAAPQEGDEALLARARMAAAEQHAIHTAVTSTSDRLLLDRAMQKVLQNVVSQSTAPIAQSHPPSRGRAVTVLAGLAFLLVSTSVLQAATGVPGRWVRVVITALQPPPPVAPTEARASRARPLVVPAAPPLADLEVTATPAEAPAPESTPAAKAALPTLKTHVPSADKFSDEPSRLLARAIAARNAGKIRQSIALYENLQRRYPTSEEAAVSHVSLARLFLDRSTQPERALVHYQLYLRRHSQGVLAEEALAGAALAAAKQGKTQLAERYRIALRARFPGSIHLQGP